MSNTGLLVVDVQPAYDTWCAQIAEKVASRINNTRKPTAVMWVGDGITTDTQDDVREYLRSHGARPGKLDLCTFIEKDYGFFRGWMDYGVCYDVIRKVGKEMLNKYFYGSEQMDLESLLGAHMDQLPTYDHIRTPHFNDSKLLALDGFETCGGGSNECLAEVELWLDMVDKPYTRLPQLVYGN